MENQDKKPKIKSFFSNNLGKVDPKDLSNMKLKLDLLEKRVRLLETDNKKLKDELKKLS